MPFSRPPFDRFKRAIERNAFLALYTRGLTSEDLQRLFTRDTIDAYKFFARGIDPATIASLPRYKRAWAHTRLFFMAFTLKLSPARRLVYGVGVLAMLVGLIQMASSVHGRLFPHGTFYVVLAFLLTNLLVLLEVADRL